MIKKSKTQHHVTWHHFGGQALGKVFHITPNHGLLLRHLDQAFLLLLLLVTATAAGHRPATRVSTRHLPRLREGTRSDENGDGSDDDRGSGHRTWPSSTCEELGPHSVTYLRIPICSQSLNGPLFERTHVPVPRKITVPHPETTTAAGFQASKSLPAHEHT